LVFLDLEANTWQERPCTRCVKRNIGHLCHDEPRESFKKSKVDSTALTVNEEEQHSPKQSKSSPPGAVPDGFEAGTDPLELQDSALAIALSAGPQPESQDPVPINQSTTANATQPELIESLNQQRLYCLYPSSTFQLLMPADLGYDDWTLNQFQDMHTFHPSYAFNAHEVTNEYNLLNSFLNNSLNDENAFRPDEDGQVSFPDSGPSGMPVSGSGRPAQLQLLSPSSQSSTAQEGILTRPADVVQVDKTREYFLTAADPAGNEAPEERMQKILKAQYEAGKLKPFNYVKGYARLDRYMARNMHSTSRQRILRQLDKFRPKFRERMHALADIELVYVEMWFERCLMEYDRVFASMAIPACCWRRTGEIFRGNKEMAELIHVPIDKLRDVSTLDFSRVAAAHGFPTQGRLAIHEIIVEDSIVSYWEKFGTIAFDNAQKAMLTSCYLKNPDMTSKDPTIHCCFSFTIRRDTHNMCISLFLIKSLITDDEFSPSLIVGNFLPMGTSNQPSAT
jgi:hypothetical protein